jgi:urease accessory protein
MKRLVPIAALFMLAAGPAIAHVGHGSTASFAAGLGHPLGGLDHFTVMVLVGLWAGLKGGRALWVWPATFVGVMLIGGILGMENVPLPFVEPAILASVVALALLVALAVDLPVSVGAGILALFALFHGHAHGTEVAGTLSGVEYMAGFALATAALHLAGIGFALTMTHYSLRTAVRVVGALCVPVAVALYAGVLQ